MAGKYTGDIRFFVVYIREAHPQDGWQVDVNVRDGVVFDQPETFQEREHIAHACSLRLQLEIPTLIDDMNDSTDLAYAALPEHLYLIGQDGHIAYKGARGPMGFKPDELEAAIDAHLAEIKV